MTWNQMLGPYENHYRELGEPIRETVRNAQALICALEVQRLVNAVKDNDKKLAKNGERIAFLTGAREDCVEDIQYPQSFGEMCLELAQNAVLKNIEGFRTSGLLEHPLHPCMKSSPVPAMKIVLRGYSNTLHPLRRALYSRPENHVYPPGSSRVNPT